MKEPLDIDNFRESMGTEKSLAPIGDFQKVQEEILKSNQRFWRPIDFPDLSPDRVQKAMAKLVGEDEIIRIIRGLYWRGEKDERDKIIYPKIIEVVKAVLEIDSGIGYGSFTAAKRLGFQPKDDFAADEELKDKVIVAVPSRSPRTVPGALIVSRSGAQGRIHFSLNWLEVSFLEVLHNWEDIEINRKNKDLLKTLADDFKGNKVDFDELSIDSEKLALASKTETAKVRDSLINIFKEIERDDLADIVMPVRKRNYHPGINF